MVKPVITSALPQFAEHMDQKLHLCLVIGYNSDMLLLFINCNSPEVDSSEPEIAFSPEATWSVKDVRNHLNNALRRGFPNAISLRNLYAELLQNRESDCPNFINSSSWTGTWEANCLTSSGSTYSGTGTLLEFFGSELPYDMSMHASFELQDSNGSSWHGGGLISFVHSIHDDEETWSHDLGGSYRYDSNQTLDSQLLWMEDFAASLSTRMNIRNNERSLLVQGGLQLAFESDDSNPLRLHFEQLDWRPEYCQSPQGILKVRDPSGYWFEIEMNCQKKCGTISWFSEDLGKYCSVSELLDAMEIWQTRWNEILEGP